MVISDGVGVCVIVGTIVGRIWGRARADGNGCRIWCQKHRSAERRGAQRAERGQVVGQGGGTGVEGVGNRDDAEKHEMTRESRHVRVVLG